MSELLLSNTNSNSEVTPNFGLEKQARDDRYGIDKFNDNMEVIDEEMHKPPLTVNQVEPDPETRDIQITTVPLADNLTSDEAQINTGTYIIRTSGGESSVADGPAWLTEIRGNQVKTGYVAESLQMTVNSNSISAEIDRDTFIEAVTASGTITLNYTSAWSSDPANYGITVNGTPESGDSIVVVYVKENRGTITTANPTSFISTGWNLYNHTAGYARVTNYSEEYGFMIDGTYTALEFAETISGTRQTITPVNGFFTVPADGYVFVTGGNGTDTAIWMTWSDWTEEANGGVFQAYTQTVVDFSGLMVSFPDGLMRIGNVYDEINLNTQRAYSRIQKVEYTEENLADVVALGVPYDVDTNYIYYVRQNPVTLTISLSGEYTVSDHGIEFFNGTAVPVVASSLYGQDLKGKLRRDVLTISAQELTAAQQAQARSNIGAAAGKNISGSSLSALQSAIITAAEAMTNGQMVCGYCNPSFNDNAKGFDGSAGTYMLARKSAGNYVIHVFVGTSEAIGYYYSSSWHWEKSLNNKIGVLLCTDGNQIAFDASTMDKIGAWIKTKFVQNRWVAVRCTNSGSSNPVIGASEFGLVFCLSSSNYGWGFLQTDNGGLVGGILYGQLSAGTWNWYKPTVTQV